MSRTSRNLLVTTPPVAPDGISVLAVAYASTPATAGSTRSHEPEVISGYQSEHEGDHHDGGDDD